MIAGTRIGITAWTGNALTLNDHGNAAASFPLQVPRETITVFTAPSTAFCSQRRSEPVAR